MKGKRDTLGIVSILVMGIILALGLLLPLMHANASEFDIEIEMFPTRGDSETTIVIFISTIPFTTHGSSRLYVYWDSYPVIINAKDAVETPGSGDYNHQWVVTFKPPKDYTSKGTHYVNIWIRNYAGYVEDATKTFRITSGVPQLEWFEELTDAELEAIRGPRGYTGKVGEKGAEGPRGPTGKTGDRGPIGETGERGERGNVGPRGDDGLVGPQGDTGKNAPMWIILVSILSMGISIMSFYMTRKEA